MTNFDRIKQMSVDEMVSFLRNVTCYTTCVYQKEYQAEMNCNEGIKKWLLKEE